MIMKNRKPTAEQISAAAKDAGYLIIPDNLIVYFSPEGLMKNLFIRYFCVFRNNVL